MQISWCLLYKSVPQDLLCCVAVSRSSLVAAVTKTKYSRMTTNALNPLKGAFNRGNCELEKSL